VGGEPVSYALKLIQFLTDLVNGFWSGFPARCVWYYARLNARVESVGEHVSGGEPWDGIEYVRCPACRRTGRAVRCVRRGRIPEVKWR